MGASLHDTNSIKFTFLIFRNFHHSRILCIDKFIDIDVDATVVGGKGGHIYLPYTSLPNVKANKVSRSVLTSRAHLPASYTPRPVFSGPSPPRLSVGRRRRVDPSDQSDATHHSTLSKAGQIQRGPKPKIYIHQ